MKKSKIIFVLLFIAVSVISIVVIFYFNSKNKIGDHILFEYSYHNSMPSSMPSSIDDAKNYYFALKDNNEFIWVYGEGNSLGSWTYATFFEHIDERGIVNLTDEEKESLLKHMKKIIKYSEPTESDYNTDVNDGEEIIIKYKNKYYNACQTRIKNGYEYERETNGTEYSFQSLQKDMISMADKYKKYHNYYNDWGWSGEKLYFYID